MRIKDIARVAHEVNRAYCEAIGDYSQKPWDEAPQWQKDSACNGVVYLIDTPHANAGDSHRSWMKEKLDTGWVFGPVKDAEKKEHPCMVLYEELPKEQRAKDYIFMAVVRALL